MANAGIRWIEKITNRIAVEEISITTLERGATEAAVNYGLGAIEYMQQYRHKDDHRCHRNASIEGVIWRFANSRLLLLWVAIALTSHP